ncbi:peptidylprolyl isomerase [Methylopila henanensis]|uniref:Parvulin-like PPIase n=1 Tax=Methylopila henanensis TaxID=873516 RepID=A0ABW4K8W3_9HYPH
MTFSLSPSCRSAALGASFALILAAVAPAAAQTPPAPAAPAAEAPTPDPKTVLATVDGAEITAGEVELAKEDLQQSLASMTEPQRRDYALNYLIDLKIAARAAEKDKLGDTTEFKQRIAYLHDRALMEELLQKTSKAAVTDEAMRKLYDETAKNLKPEQEVRASHILVKTEDEAKKVEERLGKGEDFAEIATEVSTDPGSAKQGGDLGFFGKGQMVPAFDEAVFKLEPNKVSDPVKTQFGFHIIKVTEKRERPIPPFEQVKPQIEQYVVRTAQQDLILKLRGEAKVERTKAGEPQAQPAIPGADAPPAEAPKP